MTQAIIPSVTIVGGGIIGLSIALVLQEAGEQVCIIDHSPNHSNASYGNAGHIATEQVFPIASFGILKQLPKMLWDTHSPLHLDWHYLPKILPWLLRLVWYMQPKHAQTIHQALMALNQHSLTAWQDWVQHWRCSELLSINGSLLVSEQPKNIALLQAQADQFNRLGITATWLNQTELHIHEPNLNKHLVGGIFFPQTAHIHNLSKLINNLTNHLQQLGGQILAHTSVLDIEKKSNGFNLYTHHSQLTTPKLIIATGAFSKYWVKKLTGITVPLDTERGYHLMLPQCTSLLSKPVTSYERKFIMTPMQQGLRLAGTVEFAGLNAPANLNRAKKLYELAQPLLQPNLIPNNQTCWFGFRPSIADSLPVIDKQDNIIFAFGHHHLGVTQAPITAQLVKQLYFNQPTSIPLTPYRLTRFSF